MEFILYFYNKTVNIFIKTLFVTLTSVSDNAQLRNLPFLFRIVLMNIPKTVFYIASNAVSCHCVILLIVLALAKNILSLNQTSCSQKIY